MKYTGVSTYSLIIAASAVALFSVFAITPLKASALEVNTQTQQILPLGANTCAPVQVVSFTPYVYNNALNSFDLTLNDPSYVAVIASVGNTSVPLRYMSRTTDASGAVRTHMDVDATPIVGSVPVTITLLSARAGAPVCAATVAITLGSGQVISTPVPSAPSSSTPAPVTTPAPVVTPTPVTTVPATNTPAPGAGQGSMITTGSATGESATGTILNNPLKALCASEAGAYRLWLILLVLYALVVGGLLWLEFPMSWNWAKTPERVATIILVLLVLLLAFWYLSSACRAALWMPLLAFLIAILGLLAAFWNHPRVTQLLLLEEKPKPIVTPPPVKTVIVTPPPTIKTTTTTTTTTVKKQ